MAVLIIVDSPKGMRFGSVTAAPAVSQVLEKTLPYMNITIDPTAVQETEEKDTVRVPDLVGKNASDAAGILESENLECDLDDSADNDDFIVIRQYPLPDTEVPEDTKVYLYK